MSFLEVAFWAATAVILYAYAGYPLLITALSFARPRPPRKSHEPSLLPSVSIVLVVHNEERLIEAKLTSCLESDYPTELLDILVVSDGSHDGTDAIVRDFADRGVRLMSLPGPRGKATALNHAVPAARGDVVVFTDARQAIASGAVRELVANFADPEVGAVSGALQLAASTSTTTGGGDKTAGLGAYWKVEKFVRRRESLFDSTIGATGALYAMRRALFRPLDPRIILDDVAIPMGIVLDGHRVVFEPEAEAFDRIHPDAQRELRRKVRTLAGNFQLVLLEPELLSPRQNRLAWQFVSHKLARLLVPWLLLLVFFSSFALALDGSVVYRAAASGQMLLYALAACGAAASGRRAGILRLRLVRLPYAFVLLNVAAALALGSFLTGRSRANWKGDSETPRNTPNRLEASE